MNKLKILVILSQEYLNLTKRNQEDDLFEIHYMYSPTREELEKQLLSINYTYAIPCIPTSINKSNRENALIVEYSILDILNKFGIKTIGNSFLTSLVLQDKYACLNMSKMGPNIIIRTKYQLEKDLEEICENVHFSPIEIIPMSNTTPHTYYHRHSISIAETKTLCKEILSNTDCTDILFCEKIDSEYEFIVTLIGNPPYNIIILTQYDSIQRTLKVLETSNEYAELLNKAYELFNKFSLRDFGQFTFKFNSLSNQPILVNINGYDCLNQTTLDSILTRFSISYTCLIRIFILVYLIRKNETSEEILTILCKTLPIDIITQLVPLEIQDLLHIEYNYSNICQELSRRFLHPNEHNKFEISKMLNCALSKLPTNANLAAPFIEGANNSHKFLEKYEDIPSNPQNQQLILNESLKIFDGMMRYHSPSMLYNINPPTMFNTIVASAITNLYNPNAAARQTSAGILSMEKQIISQLSVLIGWHPQNSAGLFTTGGKICISYGIKCGLNRCKNAGLIKEPVVVTSEINHFSIESVCLQLGLSKSSCQRVPTTSEGIINYNALSNLLDKCCKENIPIACIIVSGGNTTHCPFENVNEVKKIVTRMLSKYCLTYTPYIYYDLVVGWPWLFFKDYNFNSNPLHIEEKTLNKIANSSQILQYAKLADGIGIDFHKGGFCPFANSTFLSKNAEELFTILDANIAEKHREPYHHCFANSRSATAIVSAWNVLQSTGILGFQSYIANLLHVTDILIEEFPKQGFEVIVPQNTYGFTTILWLISPDKEMNFKTLLKQDTQSILNANNYIFNFSEYLKTNTNMKYCVRFLPKYCQTESGQHVAVLALLPMTPYINEQEATSISENFGKHKVAFDKIYLTDTNSSTEMPEEVPR